MFNSHVYKNILFFSYLTVFLLICFLKVHSQSDQSDCQKANNLLIVVLSDSEVSHHVEKYENFKLFIKGQLDVTQQNQEFSLKQSFIKVISLLEKWPDVVGAWTILPILNDLYKIYSKDFNWFLFCDEDSRVNLTLLFSNVLHPIIDDDKPHFIGYPLYDNEATIIHHFAFHENLSEFPYPDFAACFLINSALINRLIKNDIKNKIDFSIDVKHEFAKFIFDTQNNTKLEVNKYFCNTKASKNDNCAIWYNWSVPNCQEDETHVSNQNVLFAIKTFSGYHQERLPFIKKTWYKETAKRNVLYFSDVTDSSLPTINAGRNTESGHCSKTFFIYNYFIKNISSIYEFLVVCDDDTLFNVKRLFNMISCYSKNPTKGFVIGERYGYGVNSLNRNYGYNYPTGGSGMIFSRNAVEEILLNCKCSSDNSPDDMIIGSCIKYLNIDFINSNLLHQARPYDYSKEYLDHQVPISFHKYWNCDPLEIYEKWLKDKEDVNIHQEL